MRRMLLNLSVTRTSLLIKMINFRAVDVHSQAKATNCCITRQHFIIIVEMKFPDII